MDNNVLRECAVKLSEIRTEIISKQPFFGRLLMHLPLGLDDCKTAYTDMKRIVFGLDFAMRLSCEELKFIMLHELMHCVLKHCTRGKGKLHKLYNISCDIVINSLLMNSMSVEYFEIDGSGVMHLAPDGLEGYLYTADEVYDMLLNMKMEDAIKKYGSPGFDIHEGWDDITLGDYIESVWDGYVMSAAKSAGIGSGIPGALERHLPVLNRQNKIDWRTVLHDFIQFDRSDYVFNPPDRRYEAEFILPSFQENAYGDMVENIWFLIDSSGSVNDEALAAVFYELKNAILQINNLNGLLSFFDTQVSEPVHFHDVNSLEQIKPIGGGGTSFEAIFSFMDEYFGEDLPKAIIIITDGYSSFPEESVAKNIPVIWIIANSEEVPPWGEHINIGYT